MGVMILKGKPFFRWGVLGAALVGLLIACSSSDNDGPRPQTPGGGNGDGGEAGDGAAPIARTPETACAAYILAQCEKTRDCGLGRPEHFERCAAFTAFCPDFQLSPGSTRTVDGLFECATALKALSCADYEADKRPPCELVGTRKRGEPCHFHSQCDSKRCVNAEPGMCGVCATFWKAGGEPCDQTNVICPDGLRCENAVCVENVILPVDAACREADRCVRTAVCTNGKCTPLPGAGQPCAVPVGFQAPRGVCARGLVCHSPGTCAEPRNPGETCGGPAPFEDPADCKGGQCPAPSDGTTKCTRFGQPGDPCNDATPCDSETAFCDITICKALPDVGESCALAGFCRSPATCVRGDGGTGPGTCQRPLGRIGEPCPCVDAFACVDGKCARKSTYEECAIARDL